MSKIKNIEIVTKSDGVWLSISTSKGRHETFRVDWMAQKLGSTVFREWAEENTHKEKIKCACGWEGTEEEKLAVNNAPPVCPDCGKDNEFTEEGE